MVPAVERGETLLFVAEEDGQVPWAPCSSASRLRANQPHRADVASCSSAASPGQGDRRGADAGARGEALARGRVLLVLDTAQRRRRAPLRAARLAARRTSCPDYALWPQGGFCDTLFMYKRLQPAGVRRPARSPRRPVLPRCQRRKARWSGRRRRPTSPASSPSTTMPC